MGRRLSIFNIYGTVEFGYNTRNFATSRTDGDTALYRVTRERILDKKNGIDMTTTYTYDAAGNVLEQTVRGADRECLETGQRYDLKDRLTHAINRSGAVTRYIYDRNDQLVKEIRPYGYEAGTDGGAGTGYTYDKNGNLVRVTNGLGELVQELSYNRRNLPVTQTDASGNRTDFAYEPDDMTGRAT